MRQYALRGSSCTLGFGGMKLFLQEIFPWMCLPQEKILQDQKTREGDVMTCCYAERDRRDK